MIINGNIEKILDFVQEHLKYRDRDLMKEYIKEHDKYGTVDYALDTNNNIVCFCRWNMSSDGRIASVLDFAINKEYRNRGIGKDFIIRALKKFHRIEKLEFQRGVRGDTRNRIIEIKNILKRNIF